MAQERTSSVIPKACGNCRVRKIRCDKKAPCSACLTSGIACPTAPGHDRGPTDTPPSASVSSQNGDLSQVSEHLERIEQTLQRLLVLNEKTESRTSQSSPSVVAEPRSPAPVDPTLYEGASSFANQALSAGRASELLARDYIQLAAAQDGLKSLRDVLQAHGLSSSAPDPEDESAQAASRMELLPASFVLQLLKRFKDRPSIVLVAYGYGDIPMLESLCQAAYFPTEPLSIGALTIMHCLLYYLIEEGIYDSDGQITANYDKDASLRICDRNIEIGLRSYEIWSNPTLDNARALMIASVRAWERSDMSRSWNLQAAAGSHALSIGLHREASYTNLSAAEAEERRKFFWLLYTGDKNLSLRLGRTPTIHDYDMDVRPSVPSSDPRFASWDSGAISCASLARLQGRVYDQLYSLSALKMSPEERSITTARLAEEFEQWHREERPPSTAACYGPEVYAFVYGSIDVLYYSLLTTLHRDPSNPRSGTITDACYRAARCSITAHLDFLPSVRDVLGGSLLQSYLNWNLLYGAFTPMMVVFLHAISIADVTDLELLQRFHDSLECVADPGPETLRLQRACAIFVSVAKQYVESSIGGGGRNGGLASHMPDAFAVPKMLGGPPMVAATNGAIGNGFELQPDWQTSYQDETMQFVTNWIEGEQNAMEYLNMDFNPI